MKKWVFSLQNGVLSSLLAAKTNCRMATGGVPFLRACILAWLSATPALGAPPPMTMNIDGDNSSFTGSAPAQNDNLLGFTEGMGRSSTMLGNMWGVRPWLGQSGITFSLQETSEVLGNVTGGIHKGFEYDGLTQADVQMDTQRAFDWYGGTFNVSALQIHGRNLSADNLGTIQTTSGIEADRGARLWEVWYQQKFLAEDRMDIKIGQQSLDQEFMVSQNANYFVNTMFGWATVPSYDLPGGGPAYPLSALGVRVRAKPTDQITLLTGLFNGSSVKDNNADDPQKNNSTGTSFPLNGGALAIAEIQYAYPGLGSMVSANASSELSGTYKFGVWYDSENFADKEYDNTAVSLASPSTTGLPRNHQGDYGLYAVADQMLWHSDEVEDRTLNFFTRLMGTPQTDRNLIDFSANAGFTLHEPFFGRDDDTVGLGMGYAHVSHRVAALDRDMTAAGNYTPLQKSETFVEATYQYQVTPWWQIQPDAQYVFNPGAETTNPNTGLTIKNEAIVGVRTNILF